MVGSGSNGSLTSAKSSKTPGASFVPTLGSALKNIKNIKNNKNKNKVRAAATTSGENLSKVAIATSPSIDLGAAAATISSGESFLKVAIATTPSIDLGAAAATSSSTAYVQTVASYAAVLTRSTGSASPSNEAIGGNSSPSQINKIENKKYKNLNKNNNNSPTFNSPQQN
jgi:flagellar hook-basal body complex protein FliE